MLLSSYNIKPFIKSLKENILRINQKAKNIVSPNNKYFSNETCLFSANNGKDSFSKLLSIDFKSKKFKYFVPLTFVI